MQTGSHTDKGETLMIAIHHRTVTPLRPTHHRMPAPPRVFEADRVYSLVVVGVADEQVPQRPILALRRHLPAIESIGQRLVSPQRFAQPSGRLDADAPALKPATGLSEAKVRSLLPLAVRQPHPLLRPLVIRATLGERILVSVSNRLAGRLLRVALVDDDYGIQEDETAGPLRDGETGNVLWNCRHAGVYPIYNQAATSSAERRCLLGVLIVEP
jgi:hypothetical protein